MKRKLITLLILSLLLSSCTTRLCASGTIQKGKYGYYPTYTCTEFVTTGEYWPRFSIVVPSSILQGELNEN